MEISAVATFLVGAAFVQCVASQMPDDPFDDIRMVTGEGEGAGVAAGSVFSAVVLVIIVVCICKCCGCCCWKREYTERIPSVTIVNSNRSSSPPAPQSVVQQYFVPPTSGPGFAGQVHPGAGQFEGAYPQYPGSASFAPQQNNLGAPPPYSVENDSIPYAPKCRPA